MLSSGYYIDRVPAFIIIKGGEQMRRYYPPVNGKQYVGNTGKNEVHDLDNEQTGKNECQIDEIIAARHAKTFYPDTLTQAHREGYDNCAYCLGGSLR